MAKRKLSSVLVLLFSAALYACGEPEETCTCTCTCGNGEKMILDVDSDEDCSNECDASCGNDSFATNYDCTTSG